MTFAPIMNMFLNKRRIRCFNSNFGMKTNLYSTIIIAVAFLWQVTAHAQSTNTIQTDLQGLVQKVQAKIASHQTTEADLADELKDLDALIAKENGAKTDEAAQIVYMKALLYSQVIQNPEKGEALLNQLKIDYKGTPFVDKMEKQEADEMAAKKIQDSLADGVAFPDFGESDLNGKPISVTGLKGKVVLVDFWATWCGPCRGELPNVIATYKKHHANGFEIIGVSLDSDRDALDSFLKKTDGMTWPQFFDGQGWHNKLAVKYGVEAIPFDVLVGPDGKIIGKELRGEELENAVADALAKK
jgi:thiol-disulfide isomerase/thioredoxin